jgi:hypothetical protein
LFDNNKAGASETSANHGGDAIVANLLIRKSIPSTSGMWSECSKYRNCTTHSKVEHRAGVVFGENPEQFVKDSFEQILGEEATRLQKFIVEVEEEVSLEKVIEDQINVARNVITLEADFLGDLETEQARDRYAQDARAWEDKNLAPLNIHTPRCFSGVATGANGAVQARRKAKRDIRSRK